MKLKVIAYARNGHTDKFGIPRQSREESPILTRIVFEPEYNVREALRGIEGYSYLWLIWGFSEAHCGWLTADAVESQTEPAVGLTWSPTVRPPRLGGNKRMGVFATRSPFRPNPIGLSSVRLLKIDEGELIVSGADVLDGTPIYDIKESLSKEWNVPERVAEDILYILRQDPRPGYQDDPERVYKMDYGGWRVEFKVNLKSQIYIQSIYKVNRDTI